MALPRQIEWKMEKILGTHNKKKDIKDVVEPATLLRVLKIFSMEKH